MCLFIWKNTQQLLVQRSCRNFSKILLKVIPEKKKCKIHTVPAHFTPLGFFFFFLFFFSCPCGTSRSSPIHGHKCSCELPSCLGLPAGSGAAPGLREDLSAPSGTHLHPSKSKSPLPAWPGGDMRDKCSTSDSYWQVIYIFQCIIWGGLCHGEVKEVFQLLLAQNQYIPLTWLYNCSVTNCFSGS